ncbi:MAG: 4-hydroxy-tetrahydrodipicolinate reductase [Oscillospiraceae bacterium]|nr:4-hydroxy-tetrahydrodipicolinate reductase [Oscillospiraceae bacterium]
MKIIVNGAMGHMGTILCNLVGASDKHTLAAGVDPNGEGLILRDINDFTGLADMVIDFSHHTAVKPMLSWCVQHKMPVVVCTTGHTEDEKAAIFEAAKAVPVFYSANMSVGIALLCQMAKKAAAVFPDADVEIIERHHNRKLDAPSGTALLLASAVKEARPDANIVCGRSGMMKREKNDISIASLRMGNLPGTHEVIITTATQSITLGHEVYDRALFAEGAISAAEFLLGKPAGLYDMKSII